MSLAHSHGQVYPATGLIPKFAAVKISAAGVVSLTAANTDTGFGLALLGNYNANDRLTIQEAGVTKALTNGGAGAIIVGDDLMVGPGGKLIKYAAAAGRTVFAKALGASSADGQIIKVELMVRPST